MVPGTGTFLAKLVFHRISISMEKAYLMRKSNLHGSDKSEARGISKIQCFHQNDNISIVVQATSFLYVTHIQKGQSLHHDIMTCLSPANAFEVSQPAPSILYPCLFQLSGLTTVNLPPHHFSLCLCVFPILLKPIIFLSVLTAYLPDSYADTKLGWIPLHASKDLLEAYS